MHLVLDVDDIWLVRCLGATDLHVRFRKDGQADRIIPTKSNGRGLLPNFSFIRVFPWFHQDLGSIYSSNCMSRVYPFSENSNPHQTSWGSQADGDTNDNERMSPRARRSESITLPPGNHPGLIRYKDEKPKDDKSKDFYTTSEKSFDSDSDEISESDLDPASDDSYDNNDSNDDRDSRSSSMARSPMDASAA